MLIQISTVGSTSTWSLQLDLPSVASVGDLKELLVAKHGLSFPHGYKILGKRPGGVMITLEDSAKVCKDIFLRGVEVPQTPVQKFLTRNGEAKAPPMRNGPGYWNGSNGTNGTTNGTNGTNGAKAKAVSAPRSEQKRSWLRICQQVWRVPGAQSVNIAQMTEAGTMVGQIMTALSKEVVQQQLDSFFQLLQGDHLQAAEGREANIIECIMGVSRLLCGASQAIFKKHHGDDSLRSFSTFFGALEEASTMDQVSKLLGSLQYVIWMGHDQRGSVPRKQPVKAIPSSIVFAYAHHAALAPLERRKRSTARTLAFLEMMMREYGKDLARCSKVSRVWILGAQDGVEGELATAGYFEEAAGFLPGEGEVLQLQLLGVTQPATAVGTRVRVQIQGLDGPDLVFCPNVTVESLLPLLREASTDRTLAEHPVAATCRSGEEAEKLLTVMEQLGAQVILRKVRNLFSGMAAGAAATYDEHGWVTVVRGISREKLENFQLGDLTEAQPEEKSEKRSPAVFWGILDLKYDPTVAMEQRVKVLETGDGRSSKFSGYGAAIKENFKADKRLEETLHRAVLVENKKLTHEFFVESGYEHLMPRQMCFRRSYYETLALDLIEGLGLSAGSGPERACVLKLCNRARGAGCIPIKATDLDVALERLLTLPENAEEWLKEQDDQFPRNCKWGCFEEQVRHWWSNECPVFVAEELCHSAPVVQDGQHFDGTMRVGFSLHRIEEPSENAKDSEEEELLSGFEPSPPDALPSMQWPGDLRPGTLTIQWLGGYWKLPAEDMTSKDLSGKIISKARQGTAPVDKGHLHEVYVALGDAVQLVFTNAGLSPQTLLRRYPKINELGAFIAARLACSMRIRDPNKSNQVLGLAQAAVSKCSASPCKDFVESYIHRNFGVIDAMMGKKKAVEHLKKAIAVMPTNATARYLLGMQHLESEQWTAAIGSFEESLQLDPDFKAPWINMAVAFLRLRQWQRVLEVSDAALYRHPNTAHCFYNKGLAYFFLALEQEQALFQGGRWHPAAYRTQALQAFQDARSNLERSSLWTERDDQLVNSLQNVDSFLSKPMSWDGWKFFAWRP